LEAASGGCIVALSDRGTADDVVSALRERYYGSRSVPADLDNSLFVTEPSGGASVSEL
jgi:galactokinase